MAIEIPPQKCAHCKSWHSPDAQCGLCPQKHYLAWRWHIEQQTYIYVCHRHSEVERRPKIQAVRFFYGDNCYICGEYATTVDHVLPRGKFKIGHLANYRPACSNCNKNKAADLPSEDDILRIDLAPWLREQIKVYKDAGGT